MSSMKRWLASGLVVLFVLGCGERGDETQTMQSALDAVTMMVMPVTTGSDGARNHFMQGQQAMDVGRFIEANAHFEQAITADPTFAYGYLRTAQTASSLDEYRTNLELAERNAGTASQAEQILIRIERKGFENDTEEQLELAKQLTEMQASSPRAWLTLAGVQTSMDRNQDARASIGKALELAPRLLVAHTQLGNSFLFTEPRDFAQAERHFRHAVEMAPNEQAMHDFLGDALRAQGKLEEARAEYTRAHELDPDNASPLQQRGHVNSFLGNYSAARADYDSAIARGKANQKAAFAQWRAYVHVYEGNPQAAVTELRQLVTNIDQMDIPEPQGLKISALTNAAIISAHTGMLDQAGQLLQQRRQLIMARADQVGTEEFRRQQEANITYFDAWLAAKRGNYQRARQLTDRLTTLVEPDMNPRKMEGVHELMGYIDLYQGKHASAATHLKQGNLNNIYTKFALAQAEEGAGNTEEAMRLYRDVATNNFNSVGYALVRKDAMQKAG